MASTYLKYVGNYDRQSYTKSDFTRHGVSDEAAAQLTFNPGDVKEVSQEVADFVMEHHPGNFVETDENGRETKSSGRPEGTDENELGQYDGQDVTESGANLAETAQEAQQHGAVDAAPQTTGVTETNAPGTTTSASATRSGKGKSSSSKSR